MDFSVAEHTAGDYPVLTVRGEVDVYSAPELQTTLTALLERDPPALVVDLTEVGFLDSTGLGVLVVAQQSGPTLVLACDNSRILKLFKITGLDSVFDIHPSVDAAVQSLSQRTSSG